MAGRPRLRIGAHGKIKRVYLGGGVWLARCRYRDSDGVTRVVQRLGPADEYDQHGKLAEDALVAALTERKQAVTYGEISLETKVLSLVEQHLDRLAEDGRSPVTMSTYRFSANKLTKFIGGLRVGEASPARIDAALRSMRSAHGSTMARQSKSILRGALQLAVMASVLGSNPVRDVQPVRPNDNLNLNPWMGRRFNRRVNSENAFWPGTIRVLKSYWSTVREGTFDALIIYVHRWVGGV
jgi:hypothetical protein